MDSALDYDNPAKRRRIFKQEPDTSPVLPAAEQLASNDYPAFADSSHEADGNDDIASEPDGMGYDESEEPFPSCSAFDPAVKCIKKRAEISITELAKMLEQYMSVNKDLEIMRSRCDEVMKSRTKTTRVALLGGTGAGKSSLLTAITDSPGLAKELSAGESCTSVPMVYKHKLSGQTLPYAAKILYYSTAKCREVLNEQIEHYNRFTFNFDQTWTESEKIEYQQAADTAEHTFRALFCDESEFESECATTMTLSKTCTSAKQEELIDTMVVWYTERLRGIAKEDDTSYTFLQGNTTAELRSVLDPLITPRHACDEPSLWPLVKEVQVGVPSSRLLRHLTIHDLPGITDTNRIRVNATQDHIRKCQVLWYVAPVERVCTDPDLDLAIRRYARRFPGTLAVVVTKVDRDVTDALAHDMRVGKRQSIGDFLAHKASIREQTRNLKIVCSNLKRRHLTGDQKNALREQEDALRASIDTLECQMFECVVDARNSHIVARLKREKAKYLPEGKCLEVYCVSNLHYAIHKGFSRREGPLLDVQATGIPSLRAYALRLTASVVWNDHKEILHRLKVLFHGVHGWALRRPVPRDGELLDVVKTVEYSWDAISEAAVDQCIEKFGTEILGRLLVEHASSADATMRYLRKITEDWHSNTFLAFFRHEGTHSTKAVGSHCWNEAFLEWQTDNVLNPAWEMWPDPEHSFNEGIERLISTLEDIPEQLASMSKTVPLPVAAFSNMLTGQIGLIRAESSRVTRRYHIKHGNIKLDACLDQYTGFFTQAMRSCYHRGKNDRGDGVCARVKKLLRDHIERQDPLAKAMDKYERAFRSAVSAQASCLDKEFQRILREIDQQFGMILRRETETPEESRARVPIADLLSRLMPDIERIELDLEEVEERNAKALIPE